MDLFYSDTFELPLPDGHRFPMAKYTLLRNRIEQQLVGSGACQLSLPPAATDEQLLLVHTLDYVSAIKSGDLTKVQERRIGFPWSEKMVERSRRSTGASIAAGLSAQQNGVAINLAGGTHHSFADSGQGFCVFNDVCVASRVLQQAGLANNVLVIDLDVHQGNGTSSIVKNDPSIFSFSMHCSKNYPFKKTSGDLDLALPAGTEDTYYLDQLRYGLVEIERQFEADFVFYLAGADPFVGDRLGLLSLSKAGLRARDEIVFGFCKERKIPAAAAMAGGYAPHIEDIVDIHFSTVQTAIAFKG
jgi:acetoin utilization deacetylase AcuC-like enzyme